MYRVNLFSIVFTIGLINAMIRPVREHMNDFGLVNTLLAGGGISFIIWFAIYSSFVLLLKSNSKLPTTKDWVMAFFAIFLFMIPSSFISWIVLAIFAGYCSFFSFKSETYARNAVLVILAISLRVPISDICLKLTVEELLQFDAITTQLVASFINPLITREGNIIITPKGHELFIMTGCTSFTNISLALLLWFTVLRTNILIWKNYFMLYMGPLIMIVIAINIWRLSMMALSKENYLFYHNGIGADIINIAILLASLSIALLSVYIENNRLKEI